jgi:hypothetical protein
MAMSATPDAAGFDLVPLAPAALVAARAQLAKAESDVRVLAYCQELVRFLGTHGDDELAGYERSAILGVCAEFVERQISPYLAEHLVIVSPLLEEIRGVYRRLRQLGTAYDPSGFRIRAFHYGVHKASYLDWRLYLSKDCY